MTFVHDRRSMADVQSIMDTLGKPMKKIDAKSEKDLDQLEKVSLRERGVCEAGRHADTSSRRSGLP